MKYDLSVILVWWLWDNFHFEPGDVLEVGKGAKLLRFHDEAFKIRIQNSAHNREITKICMDEKATGIRNAALAAKKFEIPLENIAKILYKGNKFDLIPNIHGFALIFECLKRP